MKEYECSACGCVYDPESGIEPGAALEHPREYRVRPVCGLPEDSFPPNA
jgi:rubredoxin